MADNDFSISLLFSYTSHVAGLEERDRWATEREAKERQEFEEYEEIESLAGELSQEAKEHSGEIMRSVVSYQERGIHYFDGGFDTTTLQSLVIAFASAPALAVFVLSASNYLLALINKKRTIEIQVGKLKVTAQSPKDLEKVVETISASKALLSVAAAERKGGAAAERKGGAAAEGKGSASPPVQKKRAKQRAERT